MGFQKARGFIMTRILSLQDRNEGIKSSGMEGSYRGSLLYRAQDTNPADQEE